MGFILNGLDKEDYDREYSDLVLVRRILGYFKPYKKEILIISLTLFLTSLSNTLIPIYISQGLDAIQKNPSFNSPLIYQIVGLLLFFSVFAYFMNRLTQENTATAVQSAVQDLREDTFGEVIERDLSFLNEQPTGRLVSRITNDTRDFGTTVSLTTNLLSQILLVVFITIILWNTSARLTVFLLIMVPIIFFVAIAFRGLARFVALQSNRVLAKINALIQETMSGIIVAKSFRAEQYIYDEFDDMNSESFSINLRRGLVFNSIFPVLNILSALATAIIVYFGGLEVLQVGSFISSTLYFIPGRALTYGEWFLFIQGVNYFFFPIIQIASFWSQFQQGLAASERVFSLIDSENTVTQTDNITVETLKGDIKFDHLKFGYKPEILILDDFNLHISAGENLAIVGHTGAGKSTIAKLIARFYEFNGGELLIDDKDIRTFELKSYRRHLSIISQEVFLFNTSLEDNIFYGVPKENRDYEYLNSLFKQIDALDWVENLEQGFQTKVGERGNKLSQGQKQLIAIVRTLMRDPHILIMDEATSSVDPFTEVQIQKATDILMENRTSIVIAHRLSTVVKADRIIVMREGKIIESGTHNELLKQGGHYSELYDTYFRHQTLEYIESEKS